MHTKASIASLLAIILVLSLSSFRSNTQQTATATPTQAMSGMEMDTTHSSDDLVPLVRGLYEGQDILFIHTEASDPEVASILTDMMGAEVLVVPSLAEFPPELLGKVYVFVNGIHGEGPMGFQFDVFDTTPADETYTPLRMIYFVTWEKTSEPRQLNSIAEIQEAQEAETITVKQSGTVVNMPILVWPGGQR